MRSSRAERGFTLIEIMMVVALIAVLAAIAIPNFVRQTARAKSDAEVTEIFAELRIRQEQYRFERGTYLATAPDEATLYPAAPSVNEQDLIAALPAEWIALKYRGRETARCSYGVITGPGGDNTNVGAQANAMGYVVPITDWYYILAWCDLDNDPGLDGYYLTDSVNTDIRKVNAGR
ncbi:MAG: prepilin-type N-terminal cleavage/methylation domain-containing protein [Kofleriaceae bacterium]